jgi:hypothetical protein
LNQLLDLGMELGGGLVGHPMTERQRHDLGGDVLQSIADNDADH